MRRASSEGMRVMKHQRAFAPTGGREAPSSPARERRSWLVRARLRLFMLMFRNSVRAVDLFNLPPKNFVEVGRQIEI